MNQSSKSELRKFGITVGGAFALLGLISWWRGHELPPRVLWTLSVLLIVPGLVLPSILGPVHRGWMAMAHFLGNFNTRVILTLMYYLVVTPIGFIITLFRDPLDRSWNTPQASTWVRRPQQPVDPATYRRQF